MSEEFKKLIKEKREEDFPSSFDVIHDAFLELGLDKKSKGYFYQNASKIIEQLRARVWDVYQKHERIFSEKIYRSLIRKDIDKLKARKAVEDYIHQNVENFYTLSLSNTQSRRSRAGTEFEAIISHIFMGADLPLDQQGLIGTGIFADKNLAKLVDHVVPGAMEYDINKRKTITISSKTTLRERWQQIGDEMQRTRMPQMYLATLDYKIGKNTLTQLRNNNIYPVTTQQIKKDYYSDDNIVLTFEELLQYAKSATESWSPSDFSEEDLAKKIKTLEASINLNNDKKYVKDYLCRRLNKLKP